ncbi:MAG: BrnA antitoxin family protein [Thermoproteota archaeon]|nr:BrnA antitoxin family protein [Thermoproteota archaeon]
MTSLGTIRLPRLSKTPYPRYNEGKGESISLRLDEIVLDKLRQEASQKGITLNRLVSQTIKERVDWYSNAARAGFIPVRRKLIVTLIEKFCEEEICSLAKYIAKRHKGLCTSLKKRVQHKIRYRCAQDLGKDIWLRI